MQEIMERLDKETMMIKKIKEERDTMHDELRAMQKLVRKVNVEMMEKEAEMDSLRKEVRAAKLGEETSKRALDEMVAALKEVGSVAARAREEAAVAKAETEHWKERLRAESEESLLGWAHKERGLVECLRRAEAEREEAVNKALKMNGDREEEAIPGSIFEKEGEGEEEFDERCLEKNNQKALFRRLGDLIITRKKQGIAVRV